MDFIIKAMILSIDKFIQQPQWKQALPTHAAIFADLTNMFNNVSRDELTNIIHTNFPELSPITHQIYNNPGSVHYKWNTD